MFYVIDKSFRDEVKGLFEKETLQVPGRSQSFGKDESGMEDGMLLTILNGLPDVIMRMDRELRVMWGNETAWRLSDHLIGSKCHQALHHREAPCEGCPCESSLETGKTVTGIVDLSEIEGKPYFCETVSIPLKDNSEMVTGLIVIGRDVTARELATQKLEDYAHALQHAKHEAENANIQKSRFMANMSHELRTPMNGIMGMAQLLRMTHLDDNQKDYVSLLNQSCVRMVEIVDGISELSRNENFKEKSSRVLFSIKGLMEEMRSIFGVKAIKKGLTLIIEMDEDMPEKVLGDSYRLHQTLSHVMDNAVKFTAHGTVTLKAQVMGRTAEELRVMLTVRDTGQGIPPESLPSLFDRFRDAAVISETSGQHQGPSLGLSLAKQLLDVMQGEINVTSRMGEGTVVTLQFNLGYVNDEKRRPAARATEETTGDQVKSPAVKRRRRILIAEDEVMNRLTFKMALKDDYELIFAKNGKEAVELYIKEQPDLVLLDIMMPIMDGFQVLDEIEKKGGKRVPVIACTARLVESEPEYLKGYGFNDYVSKPVELQILKKTLERHLG